MRVVCALAMLALMAGVAYAQAPVQKAGDPDPEKSQGEIEAERQAERAYKRALSNVPNAAAPTDPWGNVRGGEAPKAAAKPAAPKRTKPAEAH